MRRRGRLEGTTFCRVRCSLCSCVHSVRPRDVQVDEDGLQLCRGCRLSMEKKQEVRSTVCPECNGQIKQPTGPGRPRKFCSDACTGRFRGREWYRNTQSSTAKGATKHGRTFTQLAYRNCVACGTIHVRSQSGLKIAERSGSVLCKKCAGRSRAEYDRAQRKLWRENGDPRYERLKARENNKNARRRQRVKSVMSDVRNADLLRLLNATKSCPSCGENFSSGNPATIEHVIPLARGGTHTRDNLTVLCRSCNSRKGADFSSVRNFQLNLGMVIDESSV